MATTPDLPPGARARMWSLLAFTAVVGVAMYLTFERVEGLLVAGGVLLILLYLLLGVHLTLRRDRAAIGTLVLEAVATTPDPLWAILDGHQATVLYLSEAGADCFGHTPDVLVGQRFTDLALEISSSAAVTIAELIRFGAVGQPWRGVIQIKAEDGQVVTLKTRAIPLQTPGARAEGFVAVGPA